MEPGRTNYASLALRLGIAFTFFYAALAALLNPLAWVGFFPFWLRGILPSEILLNGFSVYEIGLALWLMTGYKLRWSSVLAAASLAGVTVFNLGVMDIVFRDVGLTLAALALFFLSSGDLPWNKQERTPGS